MSKFCKRRIATGIILTASVCLFGLIGCKETNTAEQETETEPEQGQKAEEASANEPKEYEYRESGMETDKEESVYILADAGGKPTEIKVTAALKNPAPNEKITDYTTLTDLVNKEGDEEYTMQSDGTYEWENHGEDIHYEGKADPESELPVTVKVTYFLDGQEIEPEELAGADGAVKIRFDYTNHTGEKGTLTPFVTMTGMLLSGDHVSHVTAHNGEVKYLDGDYLVYGFALPGVQETLELDDMELLKEEDIDVPEYLEVSFDAVDFELDFTATLFSNGILEQDKYDDITDRLDDMAESMGDASGSTAEFKDKIAKLKEGGQNLRQGADSLKQGLTQLDASVAQMAAADPSLTQLSQMIAELAAGSEALSDGVTAYTRGVEKACDGIEDMQEGEDSTDYETKADELQNLSDKIKKMKNADDQYQNFGGIKEGKTGSVSFILETAEIRK